MRMAGKKSKDIALIERENKILDLRIQGGKTFETIARELNYANASGAQKAYLRALKRVEVINADEYLKEDLQRIDNLVQTYWQPALEGNPKATQIIMMLMEKRAEYLGLNAPKRVQAEVMNYHGVRSLDEEVIHIARVIEFVEGIATEHPTILSEQGEGEPDHLEPTSAQGTITTAE